MSTTVYKLYLKTGIMLYQYKKYVVIINNDFQITTKYITLCGAWLKMLNPLKFNLKCIYKYIYEKKFAEFQNTKFFLHIFCSKYSIISFKIKKCDHPKSFVHLVTSIV